MTNQATPPKEIETDITKFEERNTLPQTTDSTPDALMLAIQKGYDPDFIEKMMDLKERHEHNEARKAFVKALAEFKKNAPVVHKDKLNKHFNSYYTSKGAIVNTIAPAMAEYGLTHRWEIKQPDGMVEVTCHLTHELGYSESSTMKAPPDTSGGNSKNPIQQIKSTRTYLQVATFEDVTGTASNDDSDDDGNAGGPIEMISVDQVTEINDLIKESGANEKLFLQWCGVEKVEDIPLKHAERIDYQKAKAELQRKRDKPKK